MSKRALRRHHRERLKHARKHYWLGLETARQQGIAVNTPRPCSCWMCGNARRHFGYRTRQEELHDITMHEQISTTQDL